jgi:hypothetical protein
MTTYGSPYDWGALLVEEAHGGADADIMTSGL